MGFLTDAAGWFADPGNWSGTPGIPNRFLEHVELSAFAVASAAALAIPLGALMGHVRRFSFLAIAVVNIGRAIPSFAIIALALPVSIALGLGLGFWPTYLALFLLALPPMFTNTYTGVREIDPGVVEAARGMGMRGREVLWRVEFPLALPVVIAGTRVAAVQVVATAPLAALVAWGGLGRFIIDGLAQRDFPQVFGGAVLVALLAVATEGFFGVVERLALPAGVRRLADREAPRETWQKVA